MRQDYRLNEVKRKFKKFGVTFHAGGGGHWILEREVNGCSYSYPLPTKKGRYVWYPYIQKARRKLKLLPQDGVSDEDFDNA